MVYNRITKNGQYGSMLYHDDDELNDYYDQLNVQSSITSLSNIGIFLLWLWIIIVIVVIILSSKSYWKQH